MKTKKRFLSILLSLVLVLGLVPGMSLTAYAATNIGISVSGLTVTWRQYPTFFEQDMTVSGVSDTGFTAVAHGHHDDRVNSNQWTLYYIDFQNTTDGNMKLALNYSIDLHAGSFDDGYGRVNLEGKDYSGNEFVKEASDTQSSYSGSLEFLISAHSTRTIQIVSGKSPDNNTTLTVSNLSLTAIPVTNVTLDKTTATLTVGGDPVTLTAGIEPSTATGKTVKWSTTGGVTLYTDADCTPGNEVGTDATSTLTVYAKGISAGSATVTVTSNADNTKSASCAVTVNAAALTPDVSDFTYSAPSDLTYDGTAKTATVMSMRSGMGEVTVKYYSDAECTTEAQNTRNAGTYYVGITVAEGDSYNAITSVLHDSSWQFTINRATPIATNFTYNAPSDLTYDGTPKTATVMPKEGITGMGNVTVKYYSDQWRTNEVTPTNVGTYYVGITLSEGNNYHNASSALYDEDWQFAISKQAAPTSLNDDQKPAAKIGLTYTGSDQALVTAPSEIPDGYIEVQYALGTATEATQAYTTSIPTATDAGTYYVWYKVVGDANHNDTAPACVTVSIANPVYSLVSTNGVANDAAHTWYKGSGKDVVLTVKLSGDNDVSFEHFTGVSIDGAALSASDYSAVKGSTVVTLKAATLEKLKTGPHGVRILFDNGKVDYTVTVKPAQTTAAGSAASPKTGDESNAALWLLVLAISGAGLAAVIIVKKRRA